MTVPTIGRTVIVHNMPSNGAVDQPAVITRAWGTQSTERGPIAVNLTVFPDMAHPEHHSSVMLFHTAEQAHAHCAGRVGLIAAYWPPRG